MFDYAVSMGNVDREGSSAALPPFSGWPDARTLRVFSPAREVEVLTGSVWPGLWRVTRSATSLWVRANGVRVEAVMPAEQLAWLRACDGSFLAVVQLPCASANGLNAIMLPLVVEASAIRLAGRPSRGGAWQDI